MVPVQSCNASTGLREWSLHPQTRTPGSFFLDDLLDIVAQ